MRDTLPTPRPGDTGRTKQQLSPAEQQLVELCQQIRFGRIPCLTVRGGQPVVEPGLTWTRTCKIPGQNGPHPARQATDFALKDQVMGLFWLLHEIGEGQILDLEIRDGLPCSFEVKEVLTV